VKQKGFSVIVILVVILLLLFVVGWIFKDSIIQKRPLLTTTVFPENIQSPTPLLPTVNPNQTDIIATGTPVSEKDKGSCYENAKYFVVENPKGGDLLIKYKTASRKNYDCIYEKSTSDYEIKDQEWCGSCYFYLGLEGDYLLLDFGTGPPPRGFEVFDLEKRLRVYSGLYNGPFDIRDSRFDYWKPVSIEVTNENCPKKFEYQNEGLGFGIEERVRLDLSSLNETSLNEHRCSPRQ
jgi:hypothetical protein